MSVCCGDKHFFGQSKFFSVGQRGASKFFDGHRGGTQIFSQNGDLNFSRFHYLCKEVFFHGWGDQNVFVLPKGNKNFLAHAKGETRMFSACPGGVLEILSQQYVVPRVFL